jgi:hypothetical protein
MLVGVKLFTCNFCFFRRFQMLVGVKLLTCNFCFFRCFQMLVGVETKTMHYHLLQRNILPGIGLVSEHSAVNYFGPFRDSSNTAAPGGLGVLGWKGGRREEGEGGGAWRWLGGECEHPLAALLYQCGYTLEKSDTKCVIVG